MTLFDDDQAATHVPLASPEETEARKQELERMAPDERLQGLLNVAQLREQLESGGSARYTPSRVCRCGEADGEICMAGDNHPVYCRACGSFIYNASKAEVGIKPRSVANLRDGLSASRRARILDRDHGRCVLCGDSDRLVVGHLLSVADGLKVGATREELFSEANLAAMCETCNAGLGQRSVSLLTYTIMRHLLSAEVLRSAAKARE